MLAILLRLFDYEGDDDTVTHGGFLVMSTEDYGNYTTGRFPEDFIIYVAM